MRNYLIAFYTSSILAALKNTFLRVSITVFSTSIISLLERHYKIEKKNLFRAQHNLLLQFHINRNALQDTQICCLVHSPHSLHPTQVRTKLKRGRQKRREMKKNKISLVELKIFKYIIDHTVCFRTQPLVIRSMVMIH